LPDALNVCAKAYAGATGVTLAEAEDAALVTPVVVVAVTVNVYAVPFERPVTVKGLDAPDAVKPLGELVTV
jgi:hypothetical protein